MNAVELNGFLNRGRASVWSHEERLTQVVQRILEREASAVARRFLMKATSLTASAVGVEKASTMVAVYPTVEQQQTLASADGQDPGTIHCTLVFLGDTTEGEYAALVNAMQGVAAAQPGTLEGEVGGVASFAEGPDGHPSICLPDVPGLAELRDDAAEVCAQSGFSVASNHGWTPHLTIAYTPDPSPPDESLLGQPLTFSHLSIVRGDVMRTDIPLSGVLTAAGVPEWSPPHIDEVLDVDRLAERLTTAIDKLRKQAILAFGKEMPRSVPEGGPGTVTLTAARKQQVAPGQMELHWDVTSPFVGKTLAKTGTHIAAISRNTRSDVMRAIDDAYTGGLSVRDAAVAVGGVVAGSEGARALTIARTELNRLANGASFNAVQVFSDATGISHEKTWLTAPGAPHPRHELDADLNGQTVPMDQPFDVNGAPLMYPGDPDGDPGETINCLPGSTLVSGPRATAAYRRWYEGDLVQIETEQGDVLAGTPNHPVLTCSGWKPLGALDERDYLLHASPRQLPASVRPDVEHVPAAIHEVFGTLARSRGVRRVGGRAMDFHGDGSDSEVDVVATLGDLGDRVESFRSQPSLQSLLVRADEVSGGLSSERATCEVVLGSGASPDRVMGGRRESGALLGRSVRHAREHRSGAIAPWDSELVESTLDRGAADAVHLGERLLGDAFEVQATKVARVERQSFSGHVYNLQSESGAYIANGLIVHNCRCTLVYAETGEEIDSDALMTAAGIRSASNPSGTGDTTMADAAETFDDNMPCDNCDHAMSTHEGNDGACDMEGCSCMGYVDPDGDGKDKEPDDDEATVTADGVLAAAQWQAILCPEGKATEDGRVMAPGSISWRELPLSLMAMVETSEGGHVGAELCGRIDSIWKDTGDRMTLVNGSGVFDSGDYGSEISRLVGDQTLRGNSVDLAIREFTIGKRADYVDEEGFWIGPDSPPEEEDVDFLDLLFGDGEDLIFVVWDAVIGMSTVCPFPAFEEATITLVAAGEYGVRFRMEGDHTALRMRVYGDGTMKLIVDDSITASAAGLAPEVPPAEWFDDPEFDGPTALTVTDDGRIYGHAWTWGTCHTSHPNRCVTAPHSKTDYALFHLKEVEVDTGEKIACGTITLDAPHAAQSASRKEAASHYEHTGAAVADVRVGEDEHGGWVVGALRPDASAVSVRKLRGAVLSGDWRGWEGNLELIGLLAVNIPGFPVPRRAEAVVASGKIGEEVVALLAAGIVTHGSVGDVDKARLLALGARAEGGLAALAALASSAEGCGCAS